MKPLNEIAEFKDPENGYCLVVESDERTTYAYLLDHDEQICGDVWISNLVPAPVVPEWETQEHEPPFLNVLAVGDVESRVRVGVSALSVTWSTNVHSLREARLWDEKGLLARIAVGDRPGSCRNALKPGPLATRLNEPGQIG